MNQTRAFELFTCCALAFSITSAGCGRSVDDEGRPSETSLTSAQVAANGSSETATSGPVCLTARDEGALETGGAATAPPLRASETSETGKKRPIKGPAAAAAHAKRRLDVPKEVEERAESAPEDREMPVTGTQVTTTGASVNRSAVASLAPARVTFENRLSGSYALERVRLLVDGAVSYEGPSPRDAIQLTPGEHSVEVIADYRLRDPVFAYVRHYHMDLRSTKVVPAASVPVLYVVTAQPAGGVTTPVERAAALAWRAIPAR